MTLGGLRGAFNEHELAVVRNAARRGRYQLLLGAGASKGAKNRSGAAVPDGKSLVRLLATQYPDAPIDESTTLPRAYQRSVTASSESDVWHFLKSRLSGCSHEPWFADLAGLPWKRIWSLNVDDAFENSYRGSIRERTGKLQSLNWTDPFVEPTGVEIVHLHGSVATPSPSPLIFSMKEYTASASSNAAWHIVWRAVVASEPFVILGARVLDDPDVEHAVVSSIASSTAPSLIVDPFISDGNAWELEKAGYKILRMTGEEWLQQWVELCDLRNSDLRTLYGSSAVNLPQFDELTIDHVRPPVPAHDFLGGSEPTWADAHSNLIAEFDWISKLKSEVASWAISGTGSNVTIVFGERLTGISAGLMSVAHGASASGARVLWFDRSARFDASSVLDFCIEAGPVVVVVENAHTFASDIDKLLLLAARQPYARIKVLASDRPNHTGVLEDNLTYGSYPIDTVRVRSRRPRRDARKVVSLLTHEGRLDFLERKTPAERIDHFAERDVFSAMSEVERGMGFATRLDSEVKQLQDGWEKSLIVLLALASEGGVPVSIVEAAAATATSASAIARRIANDDHLASLIEVDGDVVVPRQRTRGLESLVRAGGGAAFLDELRDMVARLAILIPRDGYRSRIRASTLVGELMSAKLLLRVFPGSDLKSFYKQLLPTYGDWNARYWEQRSILARLTSDWDPAVSFAERATTIWDDGRTRNTLAVNLMAKSRAFATLGSVEWAGLYTRARGEFESALSHDPSSGVVRYARLRATLELAETLAVADLLGSADASVLLDDWQSDYADYRLRSFQRLDSNQSAEDEKLVRRFESIRLRRPKHAGDHAGPTGTPDRIAEEIRVAVSAADLPIRLATVAAHVRRATGMPGWGRYDTFKAALLAALPTAVIDPANGGSLTGLIGGSSVDRNRPLPRRSAAGDVPVDLAAAIKQAYQEIVRPTPLKVLADSVARHIGKQPGEPWGSHSRFLPALREAIPGVEITAETPPRVLPAVESS